MEFVLGLTLVNCLHLELEVFGGLVIQRGLQTDLAGLARHPELLQGRQHPGHAIRHHAVTTLRVTGGHLGMREVNTVIYCLFTHISRDVRFELQLGRVGTKWDIRNFLISVFCSFLLTEPK